MNIRQHPLYVVGCIAVAVLLQWTLSHRLGRAVRQQSVNPANKEVTDEEN